MEKCPCYKLHLSDICSCKCDSVKPKGVGEWEDYICFKRPTKCVARFQVIGCDGQVYVPQEINIQDLLLQEKAKWKEKTEKEICILRDDESRFCNCGKNRCGYNEAIREILALIDKL